MTGAELMPMGRYEWERIVRRIRMPDAPKYLAFVLSTYADADGTRVRPGLDELVDVLDKSERQVKRLIASLVDLGLLKLVRRGGGRGGQGRTNEYRLTIPTDLLERVELVPVTRRAAAEPEDSQDIQMSPQSLESPVDNPPSPVDNTAETVDNNADPDPIEGTYDSVTKLLRGHLGSIEGTSGCPTTTHQTNHKDHPPNSSTQGELRPRALARAPPP